MLRFPRNRHNEIYRFAVTTAFSRLTRRRRYDSLPWLSYGAWRNSARKGLQIGAAAGENA
jgi:hypothetical protein